MIFESESRKPDFSHFYIDSSSLVKGPKIASSFEIFR